MSGPAELRSLVDGYARAVDQRDPVALLELFADDAEVRLPQELARSVPANPLRGASEIAAIIDAVRPFEYTRHVVHEQVVTYLDGDRASAEATCEAHHVRGGHDLILALRYRDTFVRVADRWRFAARELVVDHSVGQVPGDHQ